MYTHLASVLLVSCHLANAAELLRPAAPLITGVLAPRQVPQCPAATLTTCPDGVGCCPNGAACTYVAGQPRCNIGCGGGPQCANGGCCELGYACDATDQLCHATQTGWPGYPTPVISSNPGGVICTPSVNPGGPMTPASTPGGPIMPSSVNPGGPMSSVNPGGPMSSVNPGGPMSSASGTQTPTPTSSQSGGSSMSSPSGSASPSAPAPGTGASLSVDWESWMMWVFTWAVGLPLMA